MNRVTTFEAGVCVKKLLNVNKYDYFYPKAILHFPKYSPAMSEITRSMKMRPVQSVTLSISILAKKHKSTCASLEIFEFPHLYIDIKACVE